MSGTILMDLRSAFISAKCAYVCNEFASRQEYRQRLEDFLDRLDELRDNTYGFTEDEYEEWAELTDDIYAEIDILIDEKLKASIRTQNGGKS